MKNFFLLEGAYLILGLCVLLVTLFVSTRPFIAKGMVWKSLAWVTVVIGMMIAMHYAVTIHRIKHVKEAFHDNRAILCENRAQRHIAQTVLVQKSLGWHLDNHNFVSPYYRRPFFIARCIVKE